MRRIVILAIAGMLALAACSSDDEGSAFDASRDGGGNGGGSMMGPQAPPPSGGEKPVVTSPGGEPPATLQVEDLAAGSGAEAAAGSSVTVHYVGIAWSTNEQFDASWDRNQPFTFQLGAGNVIRGWDEGVAGMKVGGRRKLTIPPDMAYGAQGAPPVIGPNETLIFVVDLLEVAPAS